VATGGGGVSTAGSAGRLGRIASLSPDI
jgi:hypothetical protein